MTKRLWQGLGLTILLLLVVTTAASAGPGDPERVNTLRLYGYYNENARFPYDSYQGPFDLTSDEAPPKDFIQWNPAYLWHWDPANDFFRQVKVNGFDANEKVHLRQWYVPYYCEPSGLVWVPQSPVCQPDIVLEYTYTLLDTETDNPVAGLPGQTQFVFPTADNSDQLGLDDYDVNGDGMPDITLVNALGVVDNPYPPATARVPAQLNGVPTAWMDISTESFNVEVGDEIVFLDHRIKIKNIQGSWTPGDPGIQMDVHYNGNLDPMQATNVLEEDVIVFLNETLSAGRHRASIETLTGSPDNPPSRSAEFIAGDSRLKLVTEPWYVQVRGVYGQNSAEIVVGRLMTQGESFFVDGAEYEISKIFMPEGETDLVPQMGEYLGVDNSAQPETNSYYVSVPNPDGSYFADCNGDGVVDESDVTVYGGELKGIDLNTGEVEIKSCCGEPLFIDYCYESPMFKYITVRNSLPKYDDVELDRLTVLKKAVQEEEPLPFLPPYNMTHDVIDDVNIPSTADELGPDMQYQDNPADLPISPAYNTVSKRRVEYQDPAVAYFIEEAKEQRFDTNLLEEKFTHAGGWEWINIETWPWHYTEFVLPQIGDKPMEAGYTYGDYILVSSFLTQDSTDVDHGSGAVRVKFFFDPEVGKVNSADVYVNDADYNLEHYGVDANSLRIYGRADENAPFPYADLAAPFDLTHEEAPPKDFLVFNPAYHSSLEGVVVSGQDANQKVHLRQWYVPEYTEPAGDVWTTNVVAQTQAEIVKEYTYLLLDIDNNPMLGTPSETDFFFPIADRADQIGLDSYDFDGDGDDDLIHLEDLGLVAGGDFAGDRFVDLSTGSITVQVGDEIQFLDHRIVINQIDSMVPGPRVQAKVYYTGNSSDEALPGQLTVDTGGVGSAGRSAISNSAPEVVIRPFYIEVTGALGDQAARVKIGRLLKQGESFFVDGAEYGVARLGGHFGTDDDGLLYITLRNGLPKFDAVTFNSLTIEKAPVQPFEDLPFLPPFNMVHTMVDDTNGPAGGSGPDVQNPDNVVDESELCYSPVFGWDYGCLSGIRKDSNAIEERLIEGVDPLVEYFIDEAKEPRFDTNLMEEKFEEAHYQCVLTAVTGEVIEKYGDSLHPFDLNAAGTTLTSQFEGFSAQAATQGDLAPQAAQQGPTAQFALLLDSSGSIDPSDWEIIRNGVADALEDPDCFPQDGSVELTVIKFHTDAYLQVGPEVVDGTNVSTLATTIRNIPYGGGSTNMTGAFNMAATELSTSANFDSSLKQIINVVTDGNPNSKTNAAAARNDMIATLQMTEDQDEIDAEAIGDFLDIDFLVDEIVYPQPGYIAPPFSGPGWVREVEDAQELADTMCEKFQFLLLAEVSVEKECIGPFVPGETFTCNVAVTNEGPGKAHGVIVTDGWRDADPFLDSGTYNEPPGVWACSGDGDLTCVRQGEMPVGTENMSFTFVLPEDAHIDDPNGDWVFNNVIDSVAANDITPNFSISYPYDMTPVSDLIAELTALTPEVSEDGTALFKLTIYNDGPSDAAGVTITPNPGAGWINPVVAPAEALTTGLYVPAGGHTEVFISAKADATDPAVFVGATLTNEATVNLPTGYTETAAADRTDDATVLVVDALAEADLGVSFFAQADTAVPGTDVILAFQVTNAGPAEAVGPVLALNLPDGWGAALATDAEALAAFPTLDNDNADWGWSSEGGTLARRQPMPDGETETIILVAHVPADAAYEFGALAGLLGQHAVHASIASASPDPNYDDNWFVQPLDSQLEADLTIEKTLLNNFAAPGEKAFYEIVVCNEGPSDVAGIAVDDFPGLNLIAGSLVLSSDADDLYIAAGDCVDVQATVKVDSASVHPEQFCNAAEVDDENVDPGVTNLDPIVNEPATVDVCGTVGEPGTMWYGPVTMPNLCGDDPNCDEPFATLGKYFADCNGDGVVNELDVTVYVDGQPETVLELASINSGPAAGGYVLLTQDFGHSVTVTIDYCRTECEKVEEQLWQWINIETQPWDYTEFVLPELPNKWDILGDFILVSSWMTEDSTDVDHGSGAIRVKFVYDAVDGTGIYVNTLGEFEACVPPTTVELTADPMKQLLGEDVTFNATADGTNLMYDWDFDGDGVFDETTAVGEVEHAYGSTGTRIVTVKAYNACGEAEAEITVEIVSCLEPTLELEADKVMVEVGRPEVLGDDLVTVTATTLTGSEPFTFAWDFLPFAEVLEGGQEYGVFNFVQTGTFDLSLTVTNDCGDATDSVTIDAVCFGDFDGNDTRDVTGDLAEQAKHWNTEEGDAGYDAKYDVDNDGDIDIRDLLLVAMVLGPCP